MTASLDRMNHRILSNNVREFLLYLTPRNIDYEHSFEMTYKPMPISTKLFLMEILSSAS